MNRGCCEQAVFSTGSAVAPHWGGSVPSGGCLGSSPAATGESRDGATQLRAVAGPTWRGWSLAFQHWAPGSPQHALAEIALQTSNFENVNFEKLC